MNDTADASPSSLDQITQMYAWYIDMGCKGGGTITGMWIRHPDDTGDDRPLVRIFPVDKQDERA